MQILSRDSLPLGGFAGLQEYRIVTDSRLFGQRKSPATSEGIGNFVYLADAQFNPKGETGMHSHKEIDVISVMVDGRVQHEGSLEHGKSLEAGDIQVQRAGGEGFAHNEINPDNSKNRMIQLWVLPENPAQPAGYQYLTPKNVGSTHVYGGNNAQSDTFQSHTRIDIIRLEANTHIDLSNETLVYVIEGTAEFSENVQTYTANEGDLIRANALEIKAHRNLSLIVVSHEK